MAGTCSYSYNVIQLGLSVSFNHCVHRGINRNVEFIDRRNVGAKLKFQM